MIKYITNNWDFNDPPLTVIRRDNKFLEKKAKWYIEYKSEPGYTYVNALFLGSGEYYSCFPAGQLVMSEKGYKPIEKLKLHELVYTHTGKLEKITAIYMREYWGDIYTIFLKDGLDTIKCTDTHRIFTSNGKVEAQHLKVNDLVVIPKNLIKKLKLQEVDNHYFGIPIEKILFAKEKCLVYNIEVEKAHSYIVGNVTVANCNMNGDYFEDDVLKNHHKSFLKAHHYKNHDNTENSEIFGDVADVFFNPQMHRVEGIIKIDNKKSPEMIEKIEKGTPVPLSMACRVKYDICSICGNKATNIKNYCDHLKYQMCDILDDGKKVYALNPEPEFFDISEVIRGADPTAFTLRKVASFQEKNKIYIDKFSSIDKLSLLERLAEIEKKIMGWIEKKDPKIEILKKGIDLSLQLNINDLPLLNKYGLLLRPSDFNCKGGCAIYTNLLAKKASILDSIGYISESFETVDENILEKRSMLDNFVENRMQNNTKNNSNKYNVPMSYTDMLKMATLNLAILYNNKIKNLDICVLQNFL